MELVYDLSQDFLAFVESLICHGVLPVCLKQFLKFDFLDSLLVPVLLIE